MKRIIFAVGILSVGILFFTNVANADGIKEGQWSMTTTIRMEGMGDQANEAAAEMENMSPEDKAMMEKMMGGMKMKMGAQGGGMGMAMTRTQCITNDNPVPEGDNEKDCQKTHSMNGNTVHFEVTCADSHSTGQVTYQNDSMNGTIQSTSTKNGKEENVTIDINGEYDGPCALNSAAVTSRATHPSAQGLPEQGLTPEDESTTNDSTNSTNNTKKAFGGLKTLLGH